MLSGIATYFFKGKETPGSNKDENTIYVMKETEDEWLLVDISEPEENLSKHQLDIKYHSSSKNRSTAWKHQSSKAGATGLLSVELPEKIESLTTTPASPVSPTQMEGSWYITPPPCFTAGGPVHVEISPLENLLIEHPSMSVYGSARPQVLSTQNREVNTIQILDARNAENSVLNIEKVEPLQTAATTTATIINLKTNSRRGRTLASTRTRQETSALTSRTDILEHIENVRPAQQAWKRREQKQLHKSHLDRQNRTCHVQASVRKTRRKERLMQPPGANNSWKC
ncbi:tumor protein p53-inducible nuclear protein 1-like [Limulus polyphemus]|uniref:Tumor protein p53-inducible nuclear protein 1-like n=1 Tax=Limulus polyphemus TaxID=6850 RepID=A0ABM1T375_LIMPO|nr:tumor protein p53-inducible nuclear protein 1-like [Limulus polyphemus]XP_013782346.1 tumor protein p53-inducible nuclear protein 1-like [Limulus polyphemus]XP_022250331.1 tumor protein p53-inducible nuclear protein 1-like [Limulus polyphemus]